jgi:transcriptional regulator with XRE-family HTH domain
MWNQLAFQFRLKIMLQARKMTQKTLARRLKISPSTVSAWQHSPANFPDLGKLMEVAKVLRVKACWLTFNCTHCEPKEYKLFLKKISDLEKQ